MSARLSPLERIRAEIDELFASDQPLGEILEQVARASVRLVLQTALEAEVTEFLGRDRYQRATDPDAAAARPGYRNGHQPLTIKTTSGPVTLSRLLGKGATRTNALESLVIAGYVRGLSTRDIEASLTEALGPEAAVSRSTVSRICEAIATEFAAWRTRDLSMVDPLYVYLDASHFRYHEGARAEPVLCAWAITADGKPALLGLDAITAESTDAISLPGVPARSVGRGLAEPLLVITDGAPGADQRGRAGLACQFATALCPPSPKRPSQGQCRRPGPGQGRLLADLRRPARRQRPGRAGRGRRAGWAGVTPSCAEAAQRYVAQVALSLRPSTVTAIERDLRFFGRWLAGQHPDLTRLAQLTRAHLEAYKTHHSSRTRVLLTASWSRAIRTGRTATVGPRVLGPTAGSTSASVVRVLVRSRGPTACGPGTRGAAAAGAGPGRSWRRRLPVGLGPDRSLHLSQTGLITYR